MVDLVPSSIKKGPTDDPNNDENTPITEELWTSLDVLFIGFNKPTAVDALILDDQNSDRPQKFIISVWYNSPSDNEDPDKQV